MDRARANECLGIEQQLAAGWHPRAFAAIDFETANPGRASACAVAIVRVEDRRIVSCRSMLIRPPTPCFEFTGIHGIRWTDVKEKPAFPTVWRSVVDLLDGADFVAAHSAGFD